MTSTSVHLSIWCRQSGPVNQPKNQSDHPDYHQILQLLDGQLKDHLTAVLPAWQIPVALPLVRRIFRQRQYSRLAYEWSKLPSGAALAEWLVHWLQPQVRTTGLENLPKLGSCLLVANHPTGMNDGAALYKAIEPYRADQSIYVVRELTDLNPRFLDSLIPVERRPAYRNAQTRQQTHILTDKALSHGRLLTVFPAGTSSHFNGRRVADARWSGSVVRLARRYDVPIIPVHINARHSALFYLYRALGKPLANIQAMNEICLDYRRPYALTIGRAIFPDQLSGSPDQAARALQQFTEFTLPLTPAARFEG